MGPWSYEVDARIFNRHGHAGALADKRGIMRRMKYWEIIADNLSKAGWSWSCVTTADSNGRTIWIADAHRGDGKRFVAGREKKSQRTRLRERPPRVGQEKSAPFQFHSRSLIGKR
jgi:hypothetical protein